MWENSRTKPGMMYRAVIAPAKAHTTLNFRQM